MKINVSNEEIKQLIEIVKNHKTIKVSQLTILTGFSDRKIRAIREKISRNPEIWGCIIGENSRDGYYICDDIEKIKSYILDLKSRRTAFDIQIKAAEDFLYKKFKLKGEQLKLSF